MLPENPKDPNLLINEVDSDIRDNILKMDQKLRGLRAEIDARLNNGPLQSQEKKVDPNRLSMIAQEIDQALVVIDSLVNLVKDHDDEDTKKLLQSEEMRQFAAMLDENLARFETIKKDF